MPHWCNIATIESFEPCTEQELAEQTDVELFDIESLDAATRKIVHDRYIKNECSYSFSNAVRTLVMVEEAGLEPTTSGLLEANWGQLIYGQLSTPTAHRQPPQVGRLLPMQPFMCLRTVRSDRSRCRERSQIRQNFLRKVLYISLFQISDICRRRL